MAAYAAVGEGVFKQFYIGKGISDAFEQFGIVADFTVVQNDA